MPTNLEPTIVSVILAITALFAYAISKELCVRLKAGKDGIDLEIWKSGRLTRRVASKKLQEPPQSRDRTED